MIRTSDNSEWCRKIPSSTVPMGILGVLVALAASLAPARTTGAEVERQRELSNGCMGQVLELASATVKLSEKDGDGSMSLDGSAWDEPLCILNRQKRKLLVRVPGNSGEWWIKRRYVIEMSMKPNVKVECGAESDKTLMANSSTAYGKSRAMGENPCK